MTDKQIIIEGVDVSGCEHRCDTHKTLLADGHIMEFKNYCQITNDGCYAINCYYKQLKRKEQEYEELRQYHNKCCEEFEKEKKEWLEKYNQISRDFYNGKYCNKENCSLLQAKEQECEELNKENKKLKEELLDLQLRFEEEQLMYEI